MLDDEDEPHTNEVTYNVSQTITNHKVEQRNILQINLYFKLNKSLL